MVAVSGSGVYYDSEDFEIARNPFAVFKRLRDEARELDPGKLHGRSPDARVRRLKRLNCVISMNFPAREAANNSGSLIDQVMLCVSDSRKSLRESLEGTRQSPFQGRHQARVAPGRGGVDARHALGREAGDIMGAAGLRTGAG